jgi:hypothetical protein
MAFLPWGRAVIEALAVELEAAIPGARRGAASHRPGYEALTVHFADAHIPQPLALWLFAAEAGAPVNVKGFRDAVGAGLRHDADEELDRGAWKLRPLAPFSWRTHVDARHEGYRWLRNADELPADEAAAARELAERVLGTLRRARAIPGGR